MKPNNKLIDGFQYKHLTIHNKKYSTVVFDSRIICNYFNSNKLITPAYQSDIDNDKIVTFQDIYKNNIGYFNCAVEPITFGYISDNNFKDTLFLINGQHRIRAIMNLSKSGFKNKINVTLITFTDINEMKDHYFKINKDSTKVPFFADDINKYKYNNIYKNLIPLLKTQLKPYISSCKSKLIYTTKEIIELMQTVDFLEIYNIDSAENALIQFIQINDTAMTYYNDTNYSLSKKERDVINNDLPLLLKQNNLFDVIFNNDDFIHTEKILKKNKIELVCL
jgi:hypothetical protein